MNDLDKIRVRLNVLIYLVAAQSVLIVIVAVLAGGR